MRRRPFEEPRLNDDDLKQFFPEDPGSGDEGQPHRFGGFPRAIPILPKGKEFFRRGGPDQGSDQALEGRSQPTDSPFVQGEAAGPLQGISFGYEMFRGTHERTIP